MLKEYIIGLAIGWIGKHLADWWMKNRERLVEKLTTLDNKTMAWLHDKWGFDLPANCDVFDATIRRAVEFVDQYAGSARFWRETIRYLKATPLDKIQADIGGALAGEQKFLEQKINAGLEKLKNLDPNQPIADQIPAELKPVVNYLKEQLATKIATARLSASTDKPVSEVEVRASIRPAATANKINEPVEPVTQDLLKRLIAESQARQEALK